MSKPRKVVHKKTAKKAASKRAPAKTAVAPRVRKDRMPTGKPAGRPPNPIHIKIAEQLRSRPGKWALIATDLASTGTVRGIAGAKIAAYKPEGAFEATSRSYPDPETGKELHDIYARYLGD